MTLLLGQPVTEERLVVQVGCLPQLVQVRPLVLGVHVFARQATREHVARHG